MAGRPDEGDCVTWNIIWQVDPGNLSSCVERDWLADLLAQVPVGASHVDHDGRPRLSLVLPSSIVCASCPNQTSAADLVAYLERLPRPRVLYHMSDEYVEVGRDVYRHCDLVIRNGSADFGLLDDPNIIQVPLGYGSGFGNPDGGYPASSQRPCSFVFMGTMKNDREEMAAALKTLGGPHFIRRAAGFEGSTTQFDKASIMLYKNAVFVPNPKGNWNPECFRLYDALEWGCIPLIRDYSDSDYHRNYHYKLFGDHPIPTFASWPEATAFAKVMLADKAELDRLQAAIGTWWQAHKAGLRARIAEKLASPANSNRG
jgi:hypothetical protein